MSDVDALIMTLAPIAQGIADGAVLGLAMVAPAFALALYGFWRCRASFGGKSSREAAMRALASGKERP